MMGEAAMDGVRGGKNSIKFNLFRYKTKLAVNKHNTTNIFIEEEKKTLVERNKHAARCQQRRILFFRFYRYNNMFAFEISETR